MENTKESGTRFHLSGAGQLSLKNGSIGSVKFNFAVADGCLPRSGEIFGDNDFLHQAWHAGRATLCLFDIKFPVSVLGRNTANGALIIDAASFFRALAANMKHAPDTIFT